MFVILCRYLKPFESVEPSVAEHRDYLQKGFDSGMFLCSGPQVPRFGGVILAKEKSRDRLLSFLAKDPFQVRGLAEYQLIEFTPVKHAAGLDKLLE